MSIVDLIPTIVGVVIAIGCAIFDVKPKKISRKKFICFIIMGSVLGTIFMVLIRLSLNILLGNGEDPSGGTDQHTTEPESSIADSTGYIGAVPLPETPTIPTPMPPETNSTTNTINISVELDANGGICPYPNIITVEYESNYSNLRAPQRDYYTFLGWYTSPDGGDAVTENTIVYNKNSHTLYAHWKHNEVKDWILRANVPADAEIVEQKWEYTITEKKDSYNSSEYGWTQVGSYWEYSNSGTQQYAEFPVNSNGRIYYETSDERYIMYNNEPYTNYEWVDTKRTVTNEQTGVYIYYHWAYPLDEGQGEMNRLIGDYKGEEIKGDGYNLGNATKWKAFEWGYVEYNSSADAYRIDGKGHYSYWWKGRIPIYTQTYTDYVKVYQYERTISNESSSMITEGGEILNVQEFVKYRLK